MATEKLNKGLIKPGIDAIGGDSRGGTEIFLPFPTCLSLSPTFLLQIVSAKDSDRRPPASAAVTKNLSGVPLLFHCSENGFSFSRFIL